MAMLVSGVHLRISGCNDFYLAILRFCDLFGTVSENVARTQRLLVTNPTFGNKWGSPGIAWPSKSAALRRFFRKFVEVWEQLKQRKHQKKTGWWFQI